MSGMEHLSDRRDVLIGRVIDGEASGSDWADLRALAEADPSVWTELAETQRQHEALSAVVQSAGVIAEGVEIPEGALLTPGERFDRRMAFVRAWGGWAAAAAILLVWFTGLPGDGGSRETRPGQQAGLISAGGSNETSPDSILDRYLTVGRQEGRVLGEMPRRVVLDTKPVRGGLEVTYLRQIVEREIVTRDRLYRLGRDEFGKAALIPDPDPLQTKVSY